MLLWSTLLFIPIVCLLWDILNKELWSLQLNLLLLQNYYTTYS